MRTSFVDNHELLFYIADIIHTYIQAYCPPAVVEENPIMDYAKNIIFGYYGTLTVSVDGVSALH